MIQKNSPQLQKKFKLSPPIQQTFSIMGIVNVTPDSFSDGGLFLEPKAAITHCYRLIENGADIIDIGGESTKPGADFVTEQEEWERLAPVIQELTKNNLENIKLSIDTRKRLIMKKAMDLGVHYINHIATDPIDQCTIEHLARTKTSYIATHINKNPRIMQKAPLQQEEVASKVQEFFDVTYKRLINHGLSHENIYFDPGIGFGKTDAANLQLMSYTSHFASRYNIAIGISRKSWIGRLLDLKSVQDRDASSKTMELGLAFLGAKIIRTHDVKRLSRLKKAWISY